MKKLKDNRNWFVCFLLTLITFGIYGIYLMYVQIRDTNIACSNDGKHTSGLLKLFLLGLITIGIYILVWEIKLISRWQSYVENHNEKPKYTITVFLICNFLLSSFFIPPLISSILRLSAFNHVCRIYNSNGGSGSNGSGNVEKPYNPADDLWGWKNSPSAKL